MRPLVVGDVVKLNNDCLGNEAGSLGIVYETYSVQDEHGVSVAFENGVLDGFSQKEQQYFFTRIDHCEELSNYKFKSVAQVRRDLNDGVFDVVFG